MEMKKALEEAGLAGNEAKVYLALLDLGSSLAGEITKNSGVNRTNVYDALEKLIEKGLVSYVIKSNRKYFEAGNPERIIEYLNEKEQEIKKKKATISSILKNLEARRVLNKDPQEAGIYRGVKGLKSITEDVLKTGKEFLIFGAEGKFMEVLGNYARLWHKRRKKMKIPVKIIFNEKLKEVKTKASFPIMKMRFSSELYDSQATTWIYGDKTAIVVWTREPIATLIKSNKVADSYRKIFDVLWKSSK